MLLRYHSLYFVDRVPLRLLGAGGENEGEGEGCRVETTMWERMASMLMKYMENEIDGN